VNKTTPFDGVRKQKDDATLFSETSVDFQRTKQHCISVARFLRLTILDVTFGAIREANGNETSELRYLGAELICVMKYKGRVNNMAHVYEV
jgi:hypothetical protein